jgi:hypothetical protein
MRLVYLPARAMATVILAAACGAAHNVCAEGIGDAAACAADRQTITILYRCKEASLARFTTLPINAQAAYAAIESLSTMPGGISLGVGTPTEGTIAGINLGTAGSIVGNPTKAPAGSLTVTNATVTAIDNGTAHETTVTPPDSISVTPAGVVSYNSGA